MKRIKLRHRSPANWESITRNRLEEQLLLRNDNNEWITWCIFATISSLYHFKVLKKHSIKIKYLSFQLNVSSFNELQKVLKYMPLLQRRKIVGDLVLVKLFEKRKVITAPVIENLQHLEYFIHVILVQLTVIHLFNILIYLLMYLYVHIC
jgi:hypothetical protein